MSRPKLGPRDRVRVEFRLPREVAEAAYRCAHDWDVSLSEAGSRLIESGYASLGSQARASGSVHDSHPDGSATPSASMNQTMEGGCAAREV